MNIKSNGDGNGMVIEMVWKCKSIRIWRFVYKGMIVT